LSFVAGNYIRFIHNIKLQIASGSSVRAVITQLLANIWGIFKTFQALEDSWHCPDPELLATSCIYLRNAFPPSVRQDLFRYYDAMLIKLNNNSQNGGETTQKRSLWRLLGLRCAVQLPVTCL